MAAKKKSQLPKIPGASLKFLAKVQERSRKLEKRLEALTRRQLTILLVVVSLLSLLLGVVLGFLLTLPRSSQPPRADQNSSSTTPETVSETGVLKKFDPPQDGIEFYLEKEDNTKVLLKTTDKFDPAFLSTFEYLVVTVEGKMVESADGSKEILQIEKISLKR